MFVMQQVLKSYNMALFDTQYKVLSIKVRGRKFYQPTKEFYLFNYKIFTLNVSDREVNFDIAFKNLQLVKAN